MNTLTQWSVAAAFAASTVGLSPSLADDDRHRGGDKNQFATKLSSFNEVIFVAQPTPALRGALSTPGRGTFKAWIDDRSGLIHYELSYQDLEGAVTQAHIHFGQRHTVGGIVVWLCKVGSPAALSPDVLALTPDCPLQGTVTGTIGPSQVLAVAEQGIAAGNFQELVQAIRAGATYANVHTQPWPAGEIRGQIGDGDDGHGHRH